MSRTHLPFYLSTSEKFVSTKDLRAFRASPPADRGAPKCFAADRWSTRLSFDLAGPVSPRPWRRSVMVGSSVARVPRAPNSCQPCRTTPECEAPGCLLLFNGLPANPVRHGCPDGWRASPLAAWGQSLPRDPAGDLATLPRPCCTCVQWLPGRGVPLSVSRPCRAAVTSSKPKLTFRAALPGGQLG